MVGFNALDEGSHLPQPTAGKLPWRPAVIDLIQVCCVGLILQAPRPQYLANHGTSWSEVKLSLYLYLPCQ